MGTCDEAEDGFGWLIAIGIMLSVTASTASNLGVNVQKYSFNLEMAKEQSLRRPYVKQWRWWIGLFLVIFGALGDFIAFGFAPASIVTPVGSFTLVTNIFFAHLWLKEPLSKKDFIGTFLIVVGATVAVAFGDHSSKCFTVNDLKKLWQRDAMYIYIGCVAAVVLFFYCIVRSAEKVLSDAATSSQSGSRVLLSDLEVPPEAYRRYVKLHPLGYAALAGVLGAQTVLFAKSTAELLKVTFDGDSQMKEFLTYAVIICMFFTIFSQQHWLATGLTFFDALYIVPVFQAFFIAGSVIAGLVFFKEHENFTTLQWFLFPGGVLLCLVGVMVLSDRDMSGKSPPAVEDPSKSRSPAEPPTPLSPRRESVFNLILPTFQQDGDDDATVTSARSSRSASFLRPDWSASVRDNPTNSVIPGLRRRSRAATSLAGGSPRDSPSSLPTMINPMPLSGPATPDGSTASPSSAASSFRRRANTTTGTPRRRSVFSMVTGDGGRLTSPGVSSPMSPAPASTPEPSRRKSVLAVLGRAAIEALGAGLARHSFVEVMDTLDSAEQEGEAAVASSRGGATAPVLQPAPPARNVRGGTLDAISEVETEEKLVEGGEEEEEEQQEQEQEQEEKQAEEPEERQEEEQEQRREEEAEAVQSSLDGVKETDVEVALVAERNVGAV